MRVIERRGVFLFAVIMNTVLLSFGFLIVHQGAVHKVSAGKAEMRDIIVERATEPISFWFSVGFDALVGSMLMIAGLYGIWRIFRHESSTADPDDSS